MRRLFFTGLVIVVFFSCTNKQPEGEYPITPVPFTNLVVNDIFWSGRIVSGSSCIGNTLLPFLIMQGLTGVPGKWNPGLETDNFFPGLLGKQNNQTLPPGMN